MPPIGHVVAGASPCVGVAVLCVAVRCFVVDLGAAVVVGAVVRAGALVDVVGALVVVVVVGVAIETLVVGAVVIGTVVVAAIVVVMGAVVVVGTVTVVVSPVLVVGGGSASATATPLAKSSATALPAKTPRSGIV